MAQAEGLICPACLSVYGSVRTLERHWADNHSTNTTRTSAFKKFFQSIAKTADETLNNEGPSSEREHVNTVVTDLKSMVKCDHWDRDGRVCHTCRRPLQTFKTVDHCRVCGKVFCNDHLGFTVRVNENAQLHTSGVEVLSCKGCYERFEEMTTEAGGVCRSLTRNFEKRRARKLGQMELETNKLLGRMRKLGTALNGAISDGQWAVGGSRRTAMTIEQNIVEWDTDNTSCSLCHSEFGFFGRHHHCRLCGRVVCTNNCSTLLTLNYLRKLQKKIGMKALKEKLHCSLKDYPVRACRRCNHLLDRRGQECDGRNAVPDPLLDLYDQWISKRADIELLMEEESVIRNRVYVSPEDAARAIELKTTVKQMLTVCDALGKRIATAPLPSTSSSSKRRGSTAKTQPCVQAMAIRTNVRRAIIQYMQRRLMDIQLFTTTASPNPPPKPKPDSNNKGSGSASRNSNNTLVNQFKTEAQLISAISAYAEQRHNLLDMLTKCESDEEYAILTRSLSEIDHELNRLGVTG
eukprot:CFRG5840T1